MINWETLKTADDLAKEKEVSEAQAKIAELKRNLSDTDYVTMPDYDKDKPEVLAQRQAWREEIRTLEARIEALEGDTNGSL